MRRFASAAVALFVMAGLLAAGEYTGLVTSVSKDEVKVTITKKKGEKGEEKTFKAKTFKITKTEGDDTKDLTIEDATTLIKDAKAKGFRAKITTEGEGDAEVVTKIEIKGKKK